MINNGENTFYDVFQIFFGTDKLTKTLNGVALILKGPAPKFKLWHAISSTANVVEVLRKIIFLVDGYTKVESSVAEAASKSRLSLAFMYANSTLSPKDAYQKLISGGKDIDDLLQQLHDSRDDDGCCTLAQSKVKAILNQLAVKVIENLEAFVVINLWFQHGRHNKIRSFTHAASLLTDFVSLYASCRLLFNIGRYLDIHMFSNDDFNLREFDYGVTLICFSAGLSTFLSALADGYRVYQSYSFFAPFISKKNNIYHEFDIQQFEQNSMTMLKALTVLAEYNKSGLTAIRKQTSFYNDDDSLETLMGRLNSMADPEYSLVANV